MFKGQSPKVNMVKSYLGCISVSYHGNTFICHTDTHDTCST